METATMTLADFLLARIDEDEAVARDAAGDGDRTPDDDGWMSAAGMWFSDEYHGEVRVSAWRVLAECEAKRRIVDIANAQIRLGLQARGWDNWEDMATQTLHALASPYADHPDYREEWRP